VVRFVRNGTTIRQREPSVSTMEVTAMDTASGEVHARADLSPAYAAESGVRAWRRAIDFAGGRLTVSDTFSRTADTEAVFQINVPVKPVIDGRTVTAGRLHVRVTQPEDALITALDWSSLDAAEFRSGWRIDIRGSGDAFVVELAADE
jgi:hypothetical protein